MGAKPPLGMDVLCGPCPYLGLRGDGHLVSWDLRGCTSSVSCVPTPAGMDTLCGQCSSSVAAAAWVPGIACHTTAQGGHLGGCSLLCVDLQPRHRLFHRPPAPGWRPQAHAPARALTVLDDRDVDRRGTGHRHQRLLRGHGRRILRPLPTADRCLKPRPSRLRHWLTWSQLFARRPISDGVCPRSLSQPMSGIER